LPPANPDNPRELLFSEASLPATSTRILSLGLMLSSGNQIWVKSSLGSTISFNLFGVETT
jgi:hypothetical protein